MKHLFERRFSMAEVVGILGAVMAGVAIYAYAVTIPHTFSPGTTAKSSEVNANFQALADAINMGSTTCTGNDASDKMVKVGPLCVDVYEASVWSSLIGGTQIQITGTVPCNVDGNDCSGANPIYARSVAGVTPRAEITYFQALQACALSGKRLLTNAEWQMAAAGTPDNNNCNRSDNVVANTGSFAGCVSHWGVNDMVGNVWEWVADWIQGPGLQDNWSPVTTSTFGNDLMIGINPAKFGAVVFPTALTRGGSSFDSDLAGVFALDARNTPSLSFFYIGFRCAR